MFTKKDRELVEGVKRVLDKNNNYLWDKNQLETQVNNLKKEVRELEELKEYYKFTEGMYKGKVYIMRTPLRENTPMLYLKHLGSPFGGYTWTSDKELAGQYSFGEAYRIKNDFCAFKDSKENLLIVCVDDIVDDEDFIEYKSELLKKDGFMKDNDEVE